MRFTFWFTFANLLTGCAIFPRPSDWKRCRFEVASLNFNGFGENQTEWKIDLAVHNPNTRRLKLEGLRLYAMQDQDTLATLYTPQALDLAPNDTTPIPLEAELPNATWGKILTTLQKGEEVQITVYGDAYYHSFMGTKKIPNIFKKTFKVDSEKAMGMMKSQLIQGLQGLFPH